MVRGQMPAAEYFRRKKQLIPDILAAYNSLAEDFDILFGGELSWEVLAYMVWVYS